jgi:hypothetical protein
MTKNLDLLDLHPLRARMFYVSLFYISDYPDNVYSGFGK